MSLVQCPECSSEVSSNALMCVRCGFPITKSKALSVAILLKDTQMIADLIQLGADINLADEHGKTPLKIAAETGDPEIIKLMSAPPPVFPRPQDPAPVSNADASVPVLATADELAPVLPSIAVPDGERPIKKVRRRKARPSRKETPERISEIGPANVTPEIATSDRPHRMISFLEDEEPPELKKQPQTSSGLSCLTCGGSIRPDEMSCSHCKTLIMRRYCSGCSQLIPDHATICPLCGKNVKEHFLYAKLRRAKFFISICMFAIFILLLFLLVWQQSFSETTPLQADTKRNEPKPPPITSGNPDVNEEEVNLAEPEHAPQEITLPKPEQLQENRKPHVRKPIAQLPTETSTEPEQKVEEPVVAQAPAVEETPPNPAMSASTQRALVLNAQQRIKRGRFLNNRGFSLIKEGRPSEAIPLLEQSVRSFPQGTGDVTYAYALFNLAVAYRMSGRPDIAIPILEERIKINNQRDAVQRELIAAKRQARESGQTTSDQEIR